jgi:hypothetical protein
MLPKLRRIRDAWRAAIQREWHLWKARRIQSLAKAHGREALSLERVQMELAELMKQAEPCQSNGCNDEQS